MLIVKLSDEFILTIVGKNTIVTDRFLLTINGRFLCLKNMKTVSELSIQILEREKIYDCSENYILISRKYPLTVMRLYELLNKRIEWPFGPTMFYTSIDEYEDF